MSEANAQASVKRIKRGSTESILLLADVGDIIQDIIGVDERGNVIVAPDFTIPSNQPTVSPAITVSTTTGIIVPTNPKWYYKNVPINFNDSGLSVGTFAGVFQKIVRQSDSMPMLKVINNLASNTTRSNVAIGFEGTIHSGGFARVLTKDYTAQIQERAGDVRVGTISYPDGKNGVISSQTDTVQLKANLRQGNYVIPTSEYTVKWKKLAGESWTPLKNDAGVELTGYTVTITEGMVSSHELVMAEFYDKANNQLITTDTAPVTDASDPLIILLNPNPADESLINDTDTVVYTPKVVSRSAQSTPMSGWAFSYTLTSSTGAVIRSDQGASVTVKVADSDAAGGGDVYVNVTAEKA